MQAGQGSGWRGRAMVLGLCAVLAGCGEEEGAPLQAVDLQALPADAALAQLYIHSCQQCHADPAAGAPLVGDSVAWSPRLDKGLDTLLEHSINGFQGMPPMGLCMQCSEAEFRGLIAFMASPAKPAEED
nr:c-type cytochrome [Pseudomonas sp. BMS12]